MDSANQEMPRDECTSDLVILIFIVNIFTSTEAIDVTSLNVSSDQHNPVTEPNQSFHKSEAPVPICDKSSFQKYWRCGYKLQGEPFFKYNVHLQSCLGLMGQEQDWFLSEQKCKNIGANLFVLVPPYGDLEAAFKEVLSQHTSVDDSNFYWTGWTDTEEDGCFVNHKNGTSPCLDPKFQQPIWYGGRPANGSKNCLRISSGTNFLFDAHSCNETHRSFCQREENDFIYSLQFLRPNKQIYLSDRFQLILHFVTQIDENFEIHFENTHNVMARIPTDQPLDNAPRNDYTITDNGVPGERVTESKWSFRKGDDNGGRCMATKYYELILMAQDKYKSIKAFIRYTNRKLTYSTEIKLNIITGHHYPTITAPTEDSIYNFGYYTYVCIARLGSDNETSATVGIVNVEQKDNAHYRKSAMRTWKRQYRYSSRPNPVQSGEEGVKPDNLDIRDVVSSYDWRMSGYHINITFQLGPNIGRFHRQKVLCRSDTWFGRQAQGQPQSHNVTYWPLKVKFLPLKPNLTISWSEKIPGKIVAGGKLRAKCEAFVGTLVDNPKFYWRVYSPKYKISTWGVRHFGGKIEHSELSIKGKPASQTCNMHGIKKRDDAKCIQFVVNRPLTLRNAQDYCRKQFSFDLLKLETPDDYLYYQDLVADDGFLIDLNDMDEEGVFKRLNGTIVESHIYPWYQQSEMNSPVDDCVIIRRGGLQSIPCDLEKPFICESEAGFVETTKDFNPDFGPKRTSILTIDIVNKVWLEGAKLQCEIQKPKHRTQAYRMMTRENISVVSKWSVNFNYIYKPLTPTIEVRTSMVITGLVFELICSSIVAMGGGAITWVMKQHDGQTRQWIVGVTDKPIESNPHKLIKVNLEEDTKGSEESVNRGRFARTSMIINFSMIFQHSEISCYSYSTDNVGAEELRDSYLIDIYKLNYTGDSNIKTAASMEAEVTNSYGLYILISLFGLLFLIIAAAMVVTFLAAKKTGKKKAKKTVTFEDGVADASADLEIVVTDYDAEYDDVDDDVDDNEDDTNDDAIDDDDDDATTDFGSFGTDVDDDSVVTQGTDY